MNSSARPQERPAARTLVPLGQALAMLLDGVAPVAPIELALADADALVLAEPLRAPEPAPPVAVALRAGLALRAADSYGASAYSPVPLPRRPEPVSAGEALPDGADCVVDLDAVTLLRGRAEIAEPVASGAGTRRAGEDAAAAAILCPAGTRLAPHHIGAARLAGLARVFVRRPRLGLVGLALSLDLIAGMAARRGAAVLHLDVAGDADLLVAIDGAEALPDGATIVAHGLALRPGELARLARLGSTPMVLLPPLPDAALAVALAIVLPVLDHLAAARPEPTPAAAALARKITSTIGFTEIALFARSRDALMPLAVGDLPLAAIAAAEAWLAVPPGHEGYPAGHPVAATPL